MPSQQHDKVQNTLQELSNLVSRSTGAERVWAYRNQLLLSEGYYSSDELIDMAREGNFLLDDPFSRIRRGTKICENVVISSGSAIEGEGVAIGAGTVLSRAVISGSNVQLGCKNIVSGEIAVGNLMVGEENTIAGISGENEGAVKIGSKNRITGIHIVNDSSGRILIGSNNELCSGLSLNVPFSLGSICIGHYNSLGRDGGGVISSSYRYGRGWGGQVVIGNHVEITRGAEVLGFSLLGWPVATLSAVWNLDEQEIMNLFIHGSLGELSERFQDLFGVDLDSLGSLKKVKDIVALFGVVKTRRCLLTGRVKVKDETRIQCSYLRDVLIPERWQVFYSGIVPADDKIISVSIQDRVLEDSVVSIPQKWENLGNTFLGREYPEGDAEFYQDFSWDQKEQW